MNSPRDTASSPGRPASRESKGSRPNSGVAFDPVAKPRKASSKEIVVESNTDSSPVKAALNADDDVLQNQRSVDSAGYPDGAVESREECPNDAIVETDTQEPKLETLYEKSVDSSVSKLSSDIPILDMASADTMKPTEEGKFSREPSKRSGGGSQQGSSKALKRGTPPASSRPLSGNTAPHHEDTHKIHQTAPTNADGDAGENVDGTPLPANWSELEDEYGRTYFYNSSTGASSWYRPVEESGEVVVGDWLQQFDENGHQYWVNQISGESAWEIPSEAPAHQLSDGDDQEEHEGGGEEFVDRQSIGSRSAATAGGYSIEL
jgi:hypothetical protein